jgi:transcriptional regulator with XRE-family HTH domain
VEKRSLFKLAQAIKEKRKALGLSLEELASRASISASLISKVENSRTIPSLPVALRLAKGLQTSLSELAASIDEQDDHEYMLVRKNERQKQEKEEAVGFIYHALVMRTVNDLLFDSSVLLLEKGAKRKAVSSDGHEFLFILKGSIEFRLGEEKIFLNEGDAFFFDGRIPHVPKNIGDQTAEFLAVYLLEQSSEER